MSWGGYDSLKEHAERFGFVVEIKEDGEISLLPGPGMEFLYISRLTFGTEELLAHQFLSGFSIGARAGEKNGYPLKS
jgi:hypothetical protein